MREILLSFLAATALVFGFIASLFIFVAMPLDRASCRAQTAEMAIPAQWGRLSGCRVRDPQAGWVPLANYRVQR